MSVTLPDLFAKGLEGREDKVLFRFKSGAELTYAEFFEHARKAAGALAAAGVEPGDRVAALVEKSADAAALYVGCVLSGRIFLPMNPAYSDDEVGYFLADAEPAAFIADPSRLTLLEAMAKGAGARLTAALDADGAGSWRDRVETAAPFHGSAPEAGDPAAILYTSGTTGRPKGAVLSQANLASNAATLIEAWRFTADDVLLHALPIYHAHGLFVAINTVLGAGASMEWLSKFDTDAVFGTLPRSTAMMGVPTFYTRLLDDPRLDRKAVAPIRVFISGSAPLLEETFEQFRARIGHAILERYGMTETVMSTSNPYDGPRLPGSVGPPLPGVEARVRGEDGALVGADQIGVLEVRGPNVFSGYWRRPERRADDFTEDGFFKTGDLARIDAEGVVWLVGRSKDLIISGGLNVYPKEVERVLDDVPGVKETAVFAAPHRDFGEGVVAAVVSENPARPVNEAALEAAAEKLAKFKRPKQYVHLDALPRNAMGKVGKAELRKSYADLFNDA